MSDDGINQVEFGKLMQLVESTHETVGKLDAKIDGHHDRIAGLENHNANVKKTIKVGGTVVGSIGGFIAWLLSN